MSDPGGPAKKLNLWQRLNRGETTFNFADRWKRWFALSGLVIIIGLGSLGFRGLNFSIDFKGGTVWEVPSSASVAHVRNVVGSVSSALRQATIQVLTNRETGKKTVEVQATTKESSKNNEVTEVATALAKMAGVSSSQVNVQSVGPSWGHDITSKAVRALIVFFIVIAVFVWFWFEPKMAVGALVAVAHDIVLTVGIYSLSGFQVSPDTVIAFLTILGYSLYDTIVVFDKVAENTKELGNTGRITYSELVNVSMNQVMARSINTSLVAILPIFSILVIGGWIMGATALDNFGLALFIGLTTGAYSSLFIASPILSILKEREPRWAQIKERLGNRPASVLSPAALAAGGAAALGVPVGSRSGRRAVPPRRAGGPRRPRPSSPGAPGGATATEELEAPVSGVGFGPDDRLEGADADFETPAGANGDYDDDEQPGPGDGTGPAGGRPGGGGPPGARSGAPSGRPTSGSPGAQAANRPPPRPRKKGRRR